MHVGNYKKAKCGEKESFINSVAQAAIKHVKNNTEYNDALMKVLHHAIRNSVEEFYLMTGSDLKLKLKKKKAQKKEPEFKNKILQPLSNKKVK